MYDRFGAPRVDDHEVVSTNQLKLTQPLDASSCRQSLGDATTSCAAAAAAVAGSQIGIASINKLELDTGIGLETSNQVERNDTIITTPPLRESPGCCWATETRIGQTNDFATAAKEISENIRTIESALAAINHQQEAPPSHNYHHNQHSDKHPQQNQKEEFPSTSPKVAYQLRALTGNLIEQEDQVSGNTSGGSGSLHQRPHVNTLSLSLIEETLNYFISCKQRLSQITKTFDDSNALIMLLQEKEEDLEVVGQLGQDLLRRYNELKEAYEGQRQELARFQEELARCREDNKQLSYDLASNKSLLNTFKEAEEHLLDHQSASLNSKLCTQCQADVSDLEAREQSFSLRSQTDRSLTYLENELYKQMCELKDELMEVRERELNHKMLEQERNLQLEVQLRDNERRQTDLEGENETLRDQQRELQQVIETQSKRFDELLRIFTEYQRESRLNQSNNIDNLNNNISFGYLSETSPSYDSQLNSLLFLDQSHYITQQDTHDGHDHHHPHHHHHHHPSHQHEQATQLPTPTTPTSHQNQQIVRPIVRKSSSSNLVTSTSLHEELLESMHKTGDLLESDDDDDDDDEDDDDDTRGRERQQHHRHRDGTDSGLHTRNISTSTTPVNSAGPSCLDTDDEAVATNLATSPSSSAVTSSTTTSSPDENNNNNNNNNTHQNDHLSKVSQRLNCLGLSTFTLTTLLLLCLSATFNSTTNSNLAQKLQHINLNQ